MILAIEKARKQHQTAVEMLYKDHCTVYEIQSVKDEETKVTRKKEVVVYQDLSCKLSFESMNTTTSVDGVAKQTMTVKLFLSPDVVIRPGSKILVNHDSVDTVYKSSGTPARFATHQEVMLELFERWA